jgi:SAM-dependent methyltransferase
MSAEQPLGDSYREWKDWTADRFGLLSKRRRRHFDAELKRTGLPLREPLRVLEIGFGDGRFLAYAKEKGWKVVGTEIIGELVDLARQQQYEAVTADRMATFEERSFDLVVAFDVLEHLDPAALLELLLETKRVLKPHGVLLAKFPNGDSPFGLMNQNGDVTHVSFIGSAKVDYFAKTLGATLVFVGGEAQPILSGHALESIYRLFAVPLRKLVDLLVRFIILPERKIAYCSVNLVMILRWDQKG